MSLQDLVLNLQRQNPKLKIVIGLWLADATEAMTFPDHLVEAGELKTALASVPLPKTLTVRVIVDAGINVRQQPNGTVVSALKKGTTINVSSQQPVAGWYKIASGTWTDYYITANPEYVEKVG